MITLLNLPCHLLPTIFFSSSCSFKQKKKKIKKIYDQLVANILTIPKNKQS